MSQSIVTIRLNGTPYQIGCGPGEESRIEALGKDIEEVLQSLIGSVGQIGEARLLAMAALILADRAQDSSKSAVNASDDGAGASEDAAADALERAADRILELASKLSSNKIKPVRRLSLAFGFSIPGAINHLSGGASGRIVVRLFAAPTCIAGHRG